MDLYYWIEGYNKMLQWGSMRPTPNVVEIDCEQILIFWNDLASLKEHKRSSRHSDSYKFSTQSFGYMRISRKPLKNGFSALSVIE